MLLSIARMIMIIESRRVTSSSYSESSKPREDGEGRGMSHTLEENQSPTTTLNRVNSVSALISTPGLVNFPIVLGPGESVSKSVA
jgi:hypothetical protein